MSSEEDFSLVTQNGEVSPKDPVNPLEKIRQEIEKHQAMFEQLVKGNRELAKSKDEHLQMATEFQKRSATLKNMLKEEEQEQAQRFDEEKERISALREDESRLQVEVQRAEEELHQIDRLKHQLKQQTQVSTAVPEKKVVFTGDIAEGAGASSFDMKARIVYPMEGGTALVTFEDEEVAQNILTMKEHEIKLGECVIKVKAEPVQFLMPSHIEMDTHVCPRRILISNLPKKVDESTLLDKLELHFHKKRNGGGEVESVDMLHDSGNVVITFAEDDVAKGLTDTEYHEVDISRKKHKLRVTPFVNGEIKNLKTRWSVSQRTVLLTGIPDIMDSENLQDSLEIHFQKDSNGGGEVDNFVYNPVGHSTLAIFKDDSPKSQ